MKTNILIGLGNPGKKYEQTRHNVGFMFVDHFIAELNSELNQDSSFIATELKTSNAYQASKYSKINLYTLKPQLFMNRSGEAVQEFINYYKLQNSHLIVAFDDLDLSFGQYKIQAGKTPKAHNGINSIKKILKINDFVSIRIGIENRGNLRAQIQGDDYVLTRFTDNEADELKQIFSKIKEDLFKILSN